MRKGFTLIELLAVIVILAIIALIATPIILGIINDAKEDSNKRSIENYAHAVELAVARYAADKGGVIPVGEYTANGKELINKDSNAEPKTLEVDYKGDKITGDVSITSDSKVVLSQIKVNSSSQTYDYSEKDGVTKNESNSEKTEETSRFKVSDTGILMHYERQGNETSVKIPAEVNGVKIKEISPTAFFEADVIMFEAEGLVVGLNEHAYENKSIADELGIKFVMIDEFGKGNDPTIITATNINKYNLDFNNASIIVPLDKDNLENYYLTDLDMSEMIYLEKIGDYTFMGSDHCYAQTSYGCPTSSNYDPIKATCQRAPLKSVKLPMNGKLTSIGKYAFANNKILQIEIPLTVQEIGERAFTVNELKTVNIPEGITVIEEGIFECNLLTGTVVIPSSVVHIKSHAFTKNSLLEKIIIKRESKEGLQLDTSISDNLNFVYDPNYKVQ